MPDEAAAARAEIRQALKDAVRARDGAIVLGAARALLAFGKPADITACAAAFHAVAGELAQASNLRRLKTYLVRSVTVEPMLPALAVEAVLAGFQLESTTGGYGSYMDDLLNPASELLRAEADLVFVLLDVEDIAGRLPGLCADGRGEGVEAELEECALRVGHMLQTYRSHARGRLVLAGCVLPETSSLGVVGDANFAWSLPHAVAHLNRLLREQCAAVADCVFCDLDAEAARYGRVAWSDPRMFLASRLPVAAAAFRPWARALVRTASVLFRAPRKVLCTDLDNTLWAGVLGEDGPAGIGTGSAFPGNCYLAYQRYLKQLSQRGILLAMVSKNNPADVEEAFTLRAADLALTPDDFVARKIGWNEKVEALRELAEELSLGLDSFLFVDDNPVECEAVRRHLPEVAVVEVPVDEPWTLVRKLADEAFFDTITVTADDRARTLEYKAQTERAALSQTSGSREEFLASLGIICTLGSALDAPLARSVQLLGKTNQFNLTTRRYAAAELEALAARPGNLALAVRVRDRFGDAGVVGLLLAVREGDRLRIDSLLLSCRVIGRGIESALLAQAAAHAAHTGCRWLAGEYLETKKNAPCSTFYAEHGFTSDDPSGSQWQLDLHRTMPEAPAFLTLEGLVLQPTLPTTTLETYEFAASPRIPA